MTANKPAMAPIPLVKAALFKLPAALLAVGAAVVDAALGELLALDGLEEADVLNGA